MLLRGLESYALMVPDVEGLLAVDVAGTLWVEACSLIGGRAARPPCVCRTAPTAHVVRCTLRGGIPTSTSTSFGGHGGTALQSANSVTRVWGSTLLATSGQFGDDDGGQAGHGVRQQGGVVYLSDCVLTAGHGGGADDDYDHFCECISCGHPGDGGSGVWQNGPDDRRAGLLGLHTDLRQRRLQPEPGGLQPRQPRTAHHQLRRCIGRTTGRDRRARCA